MKNVIIIGGGVAGLGAAWRLSDQGYNVKVLESDDVIGGLAKSVKIKNQILDIGPHSFFSEDKEVLKKVLDLFIGEESEVQYSKNRKMKLVFKGKYIDYPLSLKSIFQLGFFAPILSFLSFSKSFLKTYFFSNSSKKNSLEDESIEEWATNNYGKYLYINFFKPYSEQFWKMNTSQLSYRVIPNRSKKIDFAETLKHLLFKKYLDLAKSEPGDLNLQERESLPTYYPKNGFGEIANRISKKIKENGGEVLTNQAVEEILIKKDNKFVIKTKNLDLNSDHVISTIPINKVINLVKPIPTEEIIKSLNNLEYLSLILVYVTTKKINVLDCEYCYFVNRTFNRLSEMNFITGNKDPKKNNLIIAEISCHYNDSMWNSSDDEIFSLCTKDLERDNFLSKDEILNFEIIKMESVYPIYKKDYKKYLDDANSYFSNIKNFYSTGRQGQFFYGDSDQMIRLGFDVADKIVKNNPKIN